MEEAYIHVNPERSFRGTNDGPSSESRRALKGGPRVLPLKFSKTCIANGAIWVIPELYLSIQLGYIVMQFESKVSFIYIDHYYV